MINLCDTCGQTICSVNTKDVIFSDNGDIIKCNKYNSANNFSFINLELLFPNNLTDTDIIKNMSSNDIDNFFNCLNKIIKNLVEKIDRDEEEEE